MEDILSGLNDMQKKAVTTTEGPLLVLAGAGSGKTTVITRRIAYILGQGLARPWEILAITFTNKAAAEMAERIAALLPDVAGDIWIKTFHSMCLRILRYEIDKIGYGPNFNIYDTSDQKRLLKECLKDCRLNEDNYPIKSLISRISSAKNTGVDANQFLKEAAGNFRDENIAKVYALYEKKLKENNALDFDDLIGKTVELFERDPEVLSKYQTRFKYIMVDEYQDTNNAQYRLVALLADKYKRLCVVGDDDQSIYKFRGADISNILDFESQFKNAVNIKLEQNYRSTQNILDAANSVIANNLSRKSKNLWTDAGQGEKITLKACENQVDEAMYISQEIESLVASGKYKYSDIAVLYRTNAQTRSFEENLSCPYRVLSGLRFYDRKEIKDILSYLRLIYNPDDDVNLMRVINVPKRGIGDTTVDKIYAMAQSVSRSMFYLINDENYAAAIGRSYGRVKEFASIIESIREDIGKMSVSEIFDAVLERTGYIQSLLDERSPEAAGRIENIEEFRSKAVEYENSVDEPTFEGFLDNISLVSDVDNYDQNQDAIVLMTLHSAKGLEFPVVFMCGMEMGLFPSHMAMIDPDEIEEERRLCYVGITRAKRKLYMTYANSRTMYGKTESRMVSRFVSEVPASLVNVIEPPKAKMQFRFNDDSVNISKYDSRQALKNVISAYGLGTAKSTAESTKSDLCVGDRVRHKKFGDGMVISVTELTDDTELEISFDNVGTRKLMASFAKLKKL